MKRFYNLLIKAKSKPWPIASNLPNLQLEKEIQTLKSVLSVKSAEASELRSRLGMSSIKELKEDVKHSYKLLQDSEVSVKSICR